MSSFSDYNVPHIDAKCEIRVEISLISELDDKVSANGNGANNIPMNRKASLASTGINANSNLLTKTNLSTLVVDYTRMFSFSKSTTNDCKRRYDYCYL